MKDWILIETGEDSEIQVYRRKDNQVFKVWCEGKEAKKSILEMKKWEVEEVTSVEEWYNFMYF